MLQPVETARWAVSLTGDASSRGLYFAPSLCYAFDNMDAMNKLYFGDNLNILREYVPDASVDLIYLDPPFNSSATYNVLFKEKAGEESTAQMMASDSVDIADCEGPRPPRRDLRQSAAENEDPAGGALLTVGPDRGVCGSRSAFGHSIDDRL